MKKVAMIPLAMGLLIGGIAIKLGLDTLQEAKAGTKQKIITTVVAMAEIPATVTIEEKMLKTVETTETPLLGKGYFTDPKELVGRVPMFSIAKGTVVRKSLLSPPGTPPGLAVRIEPGFRAVSVKVNEVTGVAYQIRPGAHVDVIAMMAVHRGGVKDNVSRAILQNVEVAAVGRALNAKGKSGKGKASKSVTLLVKKSDAPKLHLAQTRGKITLALRSGDDDFVGDSGMVSESELLKSFGVGFTSVPEKAAVPTNVSPVAQPVKRGRVTVVHGASRRVHDFGKLAGTFAQSGGGATGGRSVQSVERVRRTRDKSDAEENEYQEQGSKPAPG